MFRSVIVLIFISIPVLVLSQQEQWQVYMNQFDKGPGTVMVNMAIKTIAPQNNLPYLVKAGIIFSDCDEFGMPTGGDFNGLYAVDDSVWSVMKKLGPIVHAGTFTYQCNRSNYYYVGDTTGIRQNLLAKYKKYFPMHEPVIKIFKDEKWEAYLDFLYPSEETQEMIKNQDVVLGLMKNGDKLEKERKVDHWIYFKTETDRECFIKFVLKKSFKIESKEKSDNPLRPHKLQISRTDKVDLFSITQITVELNKEAKKCNGDYDGWETFVIK